MKTFSFEIPSYLLRGFATVTVEAETLEEAKDKILAGEFEVDVDGEATVPSDRREDVPAEMNDYPEAVYVDETEAEAVQRTQISGELLWKSDQIVFVLPHAEIVVTAEGQVFFIADADTYDASREDITETRLGKLLLRVEETEVTLS